jgi:hypothetical protein
MHQGDDKKTRAFMQSDVHSTTPTPTFWIPVKVAATSVKFAMPPPMISTLPRSSLCLIIVYIRGFNTYYSIAREGLIHIIV